MKVLCVAPHCDDETLGCGGTLARLSQESHHVTVAVVTGHGDIEPHPLWKPEYGPQGKWSRTAWDIVRDEASRAMSVLGVAELMFENLPAALLTEEPKYKVNALLLGIVERTVPDILFVPFAFDLHNDHRLIFHSLSVAWRTCNSVERNIREIYAYEVLGETHWNAPYLEAGFCPNTWIDISNTLDLKLKALACYESQNLPFPNARSLQAVDSLARFRGSQICCEAAEAFVLIRKLI